MKNFFFYRFKNCNLLEYVITEENGVICGIFPKKIKKETCDTIIKETPLIKRAAKQLDEYFNKKRKTFDLPLKPEGTDFQLKVWKALRKIPYGKTICYRELAEMIGSPKACRAVGGANNKNPIHIVIPCHRIIGANGSLAGYAGGLGIKQFLLELEKNIE